MKWKAFLGGVVAVALASTSEPVVLETSSGKVAGTLLLPEGSGPHPVALIIAGSGPTDRDGNSLALPGKNDSLKKLAEELAASGIASLRYDKKGVGESTKVPEGDLRFDTYIDDAVEWCNRLRGDRRFSFLTIIGHSEGSLIGMVAAKKANADGFVSIAGAGRPAQDVIREQLKAAPPDLQNQANEILKSLSEGKKVEMIPAQLAALFRASVQPYLISWFRYDPRRRSPRSKSRFSSNREPPTSKLACKTDAGEQRRETGIRAKPVEDRAGLQHGHLPCPRVNRLSEPLERVVVVLQTGVDKRHEEG